MQNAGKNLLRKKTTNQLLSASSNFCMIVISMIISSHLINIISFISGDFTGFSSVKYV